MSNQKHTTLFDDLQDPKKAIHRTENYALRHAALLSGLKHARKYVLDTPASLLVHRLAYATPKELLRMLQVALPPAKTTWVELETDSEAPGTYGALVTSSLCGDTFTATITLRDRLYQHTVLPTKFVVSLGSALVISGDVPGAGNVWGFAEGTDGLAGLEGRAYVDAPRVHPNDLNGLRASLPVFLRCVVAALAMLNSVPTVMVESRPRGLRLVKGQMRPYADRTTVSLNIPKRVRAHRAYALKQINKEIHRKRLHEVRGHYRHVSHKPQAPGWTAGINPITGEPCWRKSIAPHLRGDPNLGVLEAPVTMVHGPRA